VRCGLSPEWGDHYLSLDRRYPSRSEKNRWFQNQWNSIRRFARKRGLEVKRRFFDPEGTSTKSVDPLSLPRRLQLAKLFLAVQKWGVKTVIVHDRGRLDENDVIGGLLCEEFHRVGVRVLESSSGAELTDASVRKAAQSSAGPAMIRKARRQVALWKGLVARLKSKTEVGRKPFGSSEGESEALARLRELFRILPRDRWRKRGKVWLKRRSFQDIADCLNAEGVPSRTGTAWSRRTVYGILKRMRLIR
jgi:hypothetical protein